MVRRRVLQVRSMAMASGETTRRNSMGRMMQKMQSHRPSRYLRSVNTTCRPAAMSGRLPAGPPKKRSTTAEVASKIRRRGKYYIPITDWLPQYSLNLFYGDLTAGLSLACLLVPQSMSYASGLAKLTPVAGIWSTAIPSVIYGVFGTCR